MDTKRKNKQGREPGVHHPSAVGDRRDGYLSGEMDGTEYEPIMGRPNEGMDTVVVVAGTLGVRGADYANVVRGQRSHTSSLAALGSLFTTAGDKETMESRLIVSKDETVSRSRKAHGREYIVHYEGQAPVLAGYVETMGNYQGCRHQPLFAAEVIETDSLAFYSAQRLVNAIIFQLTRNNIAGGANVISENGFGGSYLYLELMLELFQLEMPINHHHELLFLGQGKNQEIARDWLAHHLGSPTPDNVIRYLVSMRGREGRLGTLPWLGLWLL